MRMTAECSLVLASVKDNQSDRASDVQKKAARLPELYSCRQLLANADIAASRAPNL